MPLLKLFISYRPIITFESRDFTTFESRNKLGTLHDERRATSCQVHSRAASGFPLWYVVAEVRAPDPSLSQWNGVDR